METEMPIIYDGNFRGLADSKFSGVLNSFAACVGLDGHSTPGLLKINQKLTKESGAIVTALCRVRLACSDGASYWFSYTDGKIWRRSSAGAWLLVYTTVPGVGAAGCLGADEYDGYIYWATQNKLHRIQISAGIGSAASWTANVQLNWATFTNGDAEFHPMVKQNLQLFIGDKNIIAKVDNDSVTHTFTAGGTTTLDINAPERIKTLIDFDIDLLAGPVVNDNVNKTHIYRWDTESESWMSSDAIEENGINAFIRDDNYVYAQCGQFGRIYLYDGKNLVPYKRIPGDWSPTKFGEVYPQAVSTHLTIPVFGFSNSPDAANSDGNPALQGVYRFGSYGKDYPKVLDLSFPISSSATLQNLEIGAVLAIGADLLVSWKNGTSYGVDLLDWDNKYGSAYLETMVLTQAQTRSFLKTVKKFFANYASLPTGTAIAIKYKKAYEANFTALTTITDTKLCQVRAEQNIQETASLQLRFEFTVSANNAPEIDSLGYEDNVTAAK